MIEIDHEKDLKFEDCKENSLFDKDNSNSLYETPGKKSLRTSVESDGEFFSPQKKYLFRETPLRALYQNGQTPFKETRPSSVFGKRKSYSVKKSASNQSAIKESQDSNPRETFDMKNIETVLEQIKDDFVCSYESDNEDLNTTLKNDEDQAGEKIENIENSDSNSAIEVLESDFREIEALDLKPNETQDDNEPMNDKSLRSSYVVKSPILVPKRSLSVHFEASCSKTIKTPEVSSVPEEITPISVIDTKASKIKNRRGTPMFASKNLKDKISASKDRLARFQKYVKRFSRTPCREDDENVEPAEKNEKEQVTVSPKKNDIKIAKSKSINRLTVSRPSTVPIQRFVSLAEITNNFFRSARIYEPHNYSKNKRSTTKPRSPKLLTAQRCQACRKNLDELDSKTQQLKSVEPVAKNTNVNDETKSTIQRIKRTFPLLNARKKTITKAHTPLFQTDLRLKIYHQKHPNQNEEIVRDQSKSTFHARPMPDFKKLQAKADRKFREQTENRHRVIKAHPFSFASRSISTTSNKIN